MLPAGFEVAGKRNAWRLSPKSGRKTTDQVRYWQDGYSTEWEDIPTVEQVSDLDDPRLQKLPFPCQEGGRIERNGGKVE